MSATSCVMIPTIPGKNGAVVESKLFKDLLYYTNNDRKLTRVLYAIGKNPNTIKDLGNKAIYDENGELTIETLLSYTNLDLKESEIIQNLNNSLGSGIYEFDSGILKIANFNRNYPASKYMATITMIDAKDSKIEIKIVKKTTKLEKELNSFINGHTLRKNLSYRLSTMGFDISFLNDTDILIYDTHSNLTKIVSLEDGQTMDAGIADLTGKIVVGLMKNHPLYKRLRETIDENLSQSILGESYFTYSDPIEAASIKLISEQLLNNDIKNRRSELIKRMIDFIKNVFRRNKVNFEQEKIKALNLAQTIINSFTNLNFVEYILKNNEVKLILYDKDPINVATLKNIIRILDKQTAEMKSIDKKLEKKYKLLSASVSSGRLFDTNNTFTEEETLKGIYAALDLVVDTLPEMIAKLDSVNLYNLDENDPRAKSIKGLYANTLREVRAFTKMALTLLNIISAATTTDYTKESRLLYLEEQDMGVLRKLNDTLILMNAHLIKDLDIKEKELVINFYVSDVGLGKEYIVKSSALIFNKKAKGLKDILTFREAKLYSISDMLTHLEDDMSFYNRVLNSLSNASDTLLLILDKTAKLANKEADDGVNLVWDELRILEKELKDLGVTDTRMFYETYTDTDNLTGNIISKYNWGDWEKEFDTFRLEKRDEFFLSIDLKNKTENEISILWDAFYNGKRKQFHKLNSIYNDEEGMYYPNSEYLNREYTRNIEGTKFEQWLNKYMELKGIIESALPQGSMRKYRAPLFKGRTVNQIKNRMGTDGLTKSSLKTFRTNVRDTFVASTEDVEFGSQLHYNTLLEDMFKNNLDFEKDKLNRLPLFGINKLSDLNDLSTDLFHSTLSFASMALTHYSINSILGIMETTKEVLLNRTVGRDQETEYNLSDKSNSYKRFIKFLEMNIYQIGVKSPKWDSKKVVTKFANVTSKLAGWTYIAGNLFGGGANVIQGFTEMFKEGLTGEYIDIDNFVNANKWYFGSTKENLLNAGEHLKDDKISLLRRHFNIHGENKEKLRDYYSGQSYMINQKLHRLNPVGENAYIPYEIGEHYMLTISYLALMDKIKVKDKNGNSIKLFDAYEVVTLDKNDPQSKKTLKLKEGLTYLDPDTGKSREWTTKDESKLMDKAREINNNLHGIYNKLDKTAFQQNFIGAMLLKMKGYALGMINRRFGALKYSVALEKDVEGSMITDAKIAAKLIMDIANKDYSDILFDLQMLFMPGGTNLKNKMISKGFTENQFYNLRRTLLDILAIVIALVLKGIFKTLSGAGDDKDDPREENKFFGILYYFTSRLAMEQSAFNTPWGSYMEIPAITNANPVGISAIIYWLETARLLVTGETYKSGKNKGESKAKVRILRKTPYVKSIILYEDINRLAASYQYGRTTMTK